jgi:catechol 2,3-dioxygenase
MRGRTGLYHFAVLVPNRVELAHVLRSIAENEAPWQGASDHLVSEALYLADLDGNGIEVYRDRPRDEWPYQKDGTIAMATDPLDLRDVLSELQHVEDPDSWQSLAPETVIGHMHLHVRDIAEAEQFYGEILGLDLMVRYGDHASFMSAGGYHHHLGFNTWAGQGAPPPPENSVGLRWFDLYLPDEDSLKAVVQRFEAANVPLEEHTGGWIVRDPSGNGLRLLANGS